jgi:Large polyvalent protein associated domain 29
LSLSRGIKKQKETKTMSCILYSKGSYDALASLESFRQTWWAVASVGFDSPESFASTLFELNCTAFGDRYQNAGEEIESAREDSTVDYAFSETSDDFKGLHSLLKGIDYQCSDAHDYETNPVAAFLARAIDFAAKRAIEEQPAREQMARIKLQAQTEAQTAALRKLYPWAKPRNDKQSQYARAAANLRKELSLAFPSVKFSVTSKSYTGGDSVSVTWFDGPTSEEVDRIANKYQEGRFDGMVDSYDYDRSAYGSAVSEVLGRAKYVSTSRHFSALFLRSVVLDVCMEYGHDELPRVVTGYGNAAWVEGGNVPYCLGATESLQEKIHKTAHKQSAISLAVAA